VKFKKVIWSDLAIKDLIELKNYIAKNSINNAESLFQEILISTRDLSRFSKKGRIIPKINKDFYREYFIATYRIMYKLENDCVVIAGIIHMSKIFKASDLLERK